MLDDAHRILTSFLGGRSLPDLHPIQGGASRARLYRYEHDGRVFVLRLLSPVSPRHRHRHEVDLTRAAGGVAGPPVRFVADDESAIIYDYTPGRTLSLQDAADPGMRQRLAHLLSRLHAAPTDVPAATSPYTRFHNFRQRVRHNGLPEPEDLRRATRIMQDLERDFKPATARFCHLDLHTHNIIRRPDGDPVFIDWVNGGRSDPAFDLATMIAFLGLRDDARAHFLDCYQESSEQPIDEDRIRSLMPVRLFVIAATCLCQTPDDVTVAQLEHELSRTDLPGHEFFARPLADRLEMPWWQHGVIALKLGLSFVRDR